MNYQKVKDELSKLKSDETKLDSKQHWKFKKRLCPESRNAPCAMNDADGNLVASDKALTKRALEVYSDRLKGNTVEPHLKELEDDTNTLCEIRLSISKGNKTAP